jgi:hypothetical protein
MADARKVRWLLIYGTLQYLASALRAPKQVRDIEGPKYPMCCLIAEQSPWQAGTKVLTSPLTQSINIPDTIDNFLSRPNDNSPGQATPTTSTIQPDCQTQDYFSHTNVDTTSAPVSVEIPAPLRISSTRRNSISRSVSRLSLPSLSSRRNSMRLKSTTRHELPVQEHGNGPNDIHVEHPSVRSSIKSSSIISARTLSRQSSVLGDESHLHPSQRTPTLETVHMDDMVSHVASRAPCMSSSSSQSTISVESPIWSDEDSSASSKSSQFSRAVPRRKAAFSEVWSLSIAPLYSASRRRHKHLHRSTNFALVLKAPACRSPSCLKTHLRNSQIRRLVSLLAHLRPILQTLRDRRPWPHYPSITLPRRRLSRPIPCEMIISISSLLSKYPLDQQISTTRKLSCLCSVACRR